MAPSEATTLPEVVVDTAAEEKTAQPKKKQTTQGTSSAQGAGAAPATRETTYTGVTNSAAGPFDGYVPETTATGIKTDTPLKEVPQSVSVVGREQMRDQGVQNVQEALRYMPGVHADPYGYDSRGDSVLIRGQPGAWFVDGLRTTYGYNSTTVPIEPYALERIEVLRGPASMLYGQVPTGGMVNAVSKLPKDVSYTEIGVDYGSYDFKQIRFDSTGKLTEDGKWLYRIVGLARDADTQVDFVENDRLMLAPSLTYRPTKDTSITVLGNFRNDDSGSTQQFLPAIGTLTPNVNGKRVPRSSFEGEPEDYYDTDSESVSAFFDHKFSPGLKLSHTSRYTHVENGYDSHLPIVVTPLRAYTLGVSPATIPFLDADQTQVARLRTIEQHKSDIFNTDTNLTAKVVTGDVEHTILGGFDYMRYSSHRIGSEILIDNYDTSGFGYNLLLGTAPQSPWNVYNPQYGNTPYYIMFGSTLSPVLANEVDSALVDRGTEVQQQTGIYVQDQIKIGNWGAVFGLRQDWLSIDETGEARRTDNSLTGRAALLYNFDVGLTPYISYSESFTPQLGSNVGKDISTSYLDGVAADPLEGEQIELGFKYQPTGAPFMISAAIYQLKESNQIVDIDTLVGSVQGAAIKTRGFEFEAIGKITPELTAIASYSYTDAVYEKYPGVLPSLYPGYAGDASKLFPAAKIGGKVDGVPEHLASLWAIYSWQDGDLKGLSVGGGVRYVSGSESTGIDLITYEPVTIKTPDYTLFDAMVSYETPDWRWQLTAQNLEDEYVVTSCSVMRGDCFIGQGRTIITGFTYKF